jgi:hypothetical protein
MYADAVRSAMFAAHACGMTLRDNAAYIQEELPNVSLTPERRAESTANVSGSILKTLGHAN